METMKVRRDIPSHIVLFHILPRLPVTSLERFRSVCKQWYSFLRTRTFANIHTHLVTIGDDYQPKPKLLVLSTIRKKTTNFFYSEYEFRIIDCEALDDASSDSHPLPFKANQKDIEILSSLHGLVCVGIIGYSDELVLWNPLTGEYKYVIQTDSIMDLYRIASGLYYNTYDDDYKLLIVLTDLSVYIYSLKTESWRMVDSTHNYQTLSGLGGYALWGVSTCLNGDLYFLYNSFHKESLIIKFDTKIERFTMIPIPPSLEDLVISHTSMTVKRGVIHLGVKYEMSRDKYPENTYIELWKMIRDGNWEKVGAPYKADNSMDPLHWIKNKTWFMINDEHRLCIVDLSKMLYTGKGNCKHETFPCARIINTGTWRQTVNYIETFMSLDR